METIFDHNPTKDELRAVAEIEEDIDLAGYMALIEQRAEWRNWPIEYRALWDLESLFDLRKDLANRAKYTKILEDKFAKINSEFFNE